MNFTITTLLDDTFDGQDAAAEAADGNGLSLREAIGLANANAGSAGSSLSGILVGNVVSAPDLITLDSALTGQTIVLTQAAPLVITDNLVIVANPSLTGARLTLEGGASGHRLLEVEGAMVVASGVSLTGGSASDAGGGVLVHDDAVLTLANAALTDSTNTTNGGGIASYGYLAFVGGSIRNNEAVSGGGVFTRGAGDRLIVKQVNAYEGSAANGGAVFADGTNVEVQGGVFFRHSAAEEGGAFLAKNGASLSLTNTTLDENSATNGGHISIQDGVLTIDYGDFYRGSATNACGDIDSANVDIRVENSFFESGSASVGGAINLAGGALAIAGSEIYRNDALTGGGIKASSEAVLSLDDVFLSANSAQNGGGLAVDGSSLSLTGSSIATNTASDEGSGLRLINGSSLTSNDSFLSENTAQDGGAVFASDSAVVFEDGLLDGNAASNNGGAIWAKDDSSVVLQNVANLLNQAAYSGVVATEDSSLRVEGGYSDENSASAAGGAFFASGSIPEPLGEAGLAIRGFVDTVANITTNGARSTLGPMNGNTLTVIKTELRSNDAADGGAIAARNGSVDLVNVFVQDNKASGNGGGLHFEDSTATLTNTTISGNYALNTSGQNRGGGIYNDDSDTAIRSPAIRRTLAVVFSPMGQAPCS